MWLAYDTRNESYLVRAYTIHLMLQIFFAGKTVLRSTHKTSSTIYQTHTQNNLTTAILHKGHKSPIYHYLCIPIQPSTTIYAFQSNHNKAWV